MENSEEDWPLGRVAPSLGSLRLSSRLQNVLMRTPMLGPFA